MLDIRPYVPADCDPTIEIFQRAIRQTASKDYNPAQVAAWSTVNDREAWGQRRLSRPTWIAEHDGKPVGFSDLEPDGHLDMMFVHPDHQGIGVASLLAAKVEAEARALGLQRIFVEASITARPFFERRGYTLLGPITVEDRGQSFLIFGMEKLLP